MGFFSQHRKAFKSVIASFGMLFGLLAGCASNPIVEQEKEPENAQVMPVSSGNLALGIAELRAEYSGDGSFRYSGGTLSGTVHSSTALDGRPTATLTITNISSGILSVFIRVDNVKVSSAPKGDGSATIWGKKWKTDFSSTPYAISGFLAPQSSFEIIIMTQGTNKNTTISISNIVAEKVAKYATIFKPSSPLNAGTFTVDGTQVTAETTKEKTPLESYNLKFVPASGQTFVGWDINGELVSNAAEYSFSPTENNQVVFPRVYVAGTAMFSVGGMTFDDLKQAISKAKSGSDKTVVAVKDGAVASGNYTLDSGLSLLIPNEDGATLAQYATDDPKYVTKTATQCTLFRKISFSNGARLNVYGQVVVCCTPVYKTVGGAFSNHTAIPSGAYGQIELQQGSTMTFQNRAILYAWGYVTGDGLVEAQSGATVYELFQIASWRGGNVAKDMNKNKQKVFVINQYYVQNIECELKLWAGATEETLTGMYMSLEGIEKVPHPTFVFIGNGGMFNLTQGYLTKKYTPSSDRLEIEVCGNGQLSSIAFSLSITFLLIPISIDLDAKDYVLPINNNIGITIKSGSACSTNQDLGFLPGAELIVEKGASFEIQNGHNLTFYDLDNWGNYATEAKLRPVAYSPTRTKTRTEADLTDAKLVLDGTLTVGSGSYLMTTGKDTDANIGARIISPGRSGVIKFTDKSATTCPEVYQYYGKDKEVSKNYVLIDATCAKLQNGDHSYTQSAPGNTYNYDKILDRWSLSTDHATKSGLFKTIDNSGVIKTVLLENDVVSTGRSGLFHYSSKYNAGDNHYYYLQAGVVVNNKKWYQEGGKWYFFGTNQYAYQDMSAVFTASTGITGFGIQARYFFNDTATVERFVTVSNVVGLSQDITIGTIGSDSYCYYKSVKAGIGLFEKQSGSSYSVYLAKDDGSLMKDGTYYVPSNKINSIKDSSGKVLTAGLYYFDENGHMYDSNYKMITRGNAS